MRPFSTHNRSKSSDSSFSNHTNCKFQMELKSNRIKIKAQTGKDQWSTIQSSPEIRRMFAIPNHRKSHESSEIKDHRRGGGAATSIYAAEDVSDIE
ncbi:hypothetical protein L2E82_17705 [Cichorium intybus]|uniref:Uncharacterized protein n=1 Tax=Cichorium intybus TaxID=13427 RepID=A0ACB9F8U8_CICIN|nr:hypothetical protein L2E82_17705 [Cichorium intybus]